MTSLLPKLARVPMADADEIRATPLISNVNFEICNLQTTKQPCRWQPPFRWGVASLDVWNSHLFVLICSCLTTAQFHVSRNGTRVNILLCGITDYIHGGSTCYSYDKKSINRPIDSFGLKRSDHLNCQFRQSFGGHRHWRPRINHVHMLQSPTPMDSPSDIAGNRHTGSLSQYILSSSPSDMNHLISLKSGRDNLSPNPWLCQLHHHQKKFWIFLPY